MKSPLVSKIPIREALVAPDRGAGKTGDTRAQRVIFGAFRSAARTGIPAPHASPGDSPVVRAALAPWFPRRRAGPYRMPHRCSFHGDGVSAFLARDTVIRHTGLNVRQAGLKSLT
jgi:hypothetical protein